MSTAVSAGESAGTGPGHFQQRLGLFDSTMLVAGAMIGSGIFIVSAEIARDLGSAGWLLAVWVVTGIITIAGALSYAELAAMTYCTPAGSMSISAKLTVRSGDFSTAGRCFWSFKRARSRRSA